jgi:hypothetical protein
VLDVTELSGPQCVRGLGLAVELLVIGFWPLLLLAVLDVSGTARKVLVALDPVSIYLGLSGLVLWCGFRYGDAIGMSRRQTWLLAALSTALGLLGGVGLWFSES